MGAGISSNPLDFINDFVPKGTASASDKELIKAYFASNGFDALKSAYRNNPKIEEAFDNADLSFPRSDADVPAWVEDLDESQAQALKSNVLAVFKK